MAKIKPAGVFHFSPQERKDIIISWLTLSLAFAVVINPVFFDIRNLLVSLPIALLAVGTGFVFHELAHREVAKRYGFHSEFRAWYPGLAVALGLAVITFGNFIFAAPGATYFFGENVSRKQNGIISIAGPITNLVLGTVLVVLSSLFAEKMLQTVFIYAGMINFWFAFFNLIPIYPLDGSKVIAWRAEVWVLAIILSGVLVFYPNLVFGLAGISV